jgi:ketosteroid isomerase-like protein
VTTAAERVDIVRRGFDAFETMDMDRFTADWHPNVIWDVSGYEDWPGGKTTYKGAAEILQEFGNFMGSVRALEVQDLQVTARDDGRVDATYKERRINDGDDQPAVLHIGIVYEFGDPSTDLITRIEVRTL